MSNADRARLTPCVPYVILRLSAVVVNLPALFFYLFDIDYIDPSPYKYLLDAIINVADVDDAVSPRTHLWPRLVSLLERHVADVQASLPPPGHSNPGMSRLVLDACRRQLKHYKDLAAAPSAVDSPALDTRNHR